MAEGYQALTEKEKDTLRLLIRGYDTKTIATKFELSVHTINERLRNARRKMSVSSSREAARLLRDHEGEHPSFRADRFLGEAEAAGQAVEVAAPDNGHGRSIVFPMLTGGIMIMSIIFAATILASLGAGSAPDSAAPQAETQPKSARASEIAQSAEKWLTLMDTGQWEDSWNATGAAFKKLNTLEQWTAVVSEVQPSFGPVVTRFFKSQEVLPAPPNGYRVVKFQTSFKNRPSTVETVSLEREGAAWKVVGYTVD